MLGAHVIGFCEKETVNRLSRVSPLADRMDANDFKFSRSSYAIEFAGSSITSRVERSTSSRPSPDCTGAAPTLIPERPVEAQHAGTPPHRWRSPETEGVRVDAGVNKFGTNVDALDR